jgi:hypothetical protein
VAGEFFPRCGEAGGVAGEPLAGELQHFGELGRVRGVEPYFRRGLTKVEPRAVPAGLARKLACDEDTSVAVRAAKLLRALNGTGDDERRNYYHPLGM